VPDAGNRADQPVLLEEHQLCPLALHPLEEALILEGDHPVVRVTEEHVHIISILARDLLGQEICFLCFQNIRFSFYPIGSTVLGCNMKETFESNRKLDKLGGQLVLKVGKHLQQLVKEERS
jgi:hypothetical protein